MVDGRPGVHTFSRGPGVHRVLSRPRCSSRLRAWDWMSTSEAWLLPRSTGRPVRSSIGDWRTSPWRSARSRTHSPRSQGPVADYLRGWPHGVRPGPHPSRGGASGAGRGTSKSIQLPEDRGQDRPQRCNAAGPSGQRLGKLALRNGYVFPGKISWRKEHRAWLRGIRRDELGGAGIGTLMTFDDCDDTVQHA